MSSTTRNEKAGTAGEAIFAHTMSLRVRYSETDQMGTFYNSRALEWFECGRTELLRALGLPYATVEARGLYLPLVDAHVEYLGRAQYDDRLDLTTTLRFLGRARLRLQAEVVQAESGKPVARGYTTHAFTDRNGKPIRPPAWFLDAVGRVIRGRANPPGPEPPARPAAGHPA
jgi:acyl-CoA thioester hydrolase